MNAKTQTRRFSQQILRQIRSDARRALIRAHFCPERSEVSQLRCVEERPESELEFGAQLWFFEGLAVDEVGRRSEVHGAIEYSLQFGLHELIDDGIFDSEHQRARLRQRHELGDLPPTLRHPNHRYLLAGLFAVSVSYLVYLGFQQSVF